MRGNRAGRRWGLGVLGAAAWLALGPGPVPALRLETSRELLAVDIVAGGLNQPVGLATDPRYGEVYVAERGGRRVCLIRDKQNVPVLEGPFSLAARKRGAPKPSELEAPSALAFDAEGRLYVVESQGPARLLRFEPLYEGLRQATEILTPWVETPQVCTSVAVDRGGRLFVTTQNRDGKVVTVFGTVMMREVNGNWKLVDHGPFSDFSNPAIDPEGRTLVVGERRAADLSWYDARREVEIRSLEKMEGLRHLALLPDGTTLASLHRADGTWSVAEVDGMSGVVWEWVGGLGEIGGLCAHPRTGDLYVTLADEGKVMRVRRLEPRKETPLPVPSRIGRMMRSFELENAIPPPEWPEFFRSFIEQLGLVRTVNEHDPREAGSRKPPAGIPLTIAEFASTVPVVAAKVRARLADEESGEDDPVEEVSFLLFHPNRSMLTRQTVAPSLSLFWARHRSGRIERSRFLPNKQGRPLSEEIPWDEMPEMLVSFPAGFYAPETGVSENSLLRVYFLGMGLGPDYWIDLDREDIGNSRMVVEKPGGLRVDYILEPYLESPAAGGHTVLVAGLKEVEMGWHNLGQDPIPWKIVSPDAPPVQTRHAMNVELLRAKPVPQEAALADSYLPQPVFQGTDLSRRIVLRAASRWATNPF
ncbi:MAG TPA: hypothetical protein P5567_14910 [Kiritimatiellia bacterium]|nr:hypothetical protein [Kiritimatiellia bacterium]HSA19361.1 hypothetical protein [Kiritimatiellia bacterium]